MNLQISEVIYKILIKSSVNNRRQIIKKYQIKYQYNVKINNKKRTISI